MTENNQITVKGEVIKVASKHDRYDPDALGITVKPRGSIGAFWFRWTPTRGVISRGDIIEVIGIKTGESPPNRDGGTMTWLKGVKVEGKTCTHLTLIRDGKKYVCDGCGKFAKLVVEK